jgi:hypothetical protein
MFTVRFCRYEGRIKIRGEGAKKAGSSDGEEPFPVFTVIFHAAGIF